MKVSAEEIASVIAYDQATGYLEWKVPLQKNLTGSKVGFIGNDGYAYFRYKREVYLGHRVAWAIHYGHWPDQPLDHINMNKSDNRICNLRLATVTENNRNRGRQSNNTSGYKGVSLHKGSGKYQAKICTNKKTVSLGYFNTAEEASVAYQAAAKENHGEFANF